MHYDQYEITPGDTAMVYEFVSQGPRGDVPKLVVYTKIDLYDTFNLGFGDKVDAKDFDDASVTDNGDSFKVMATVAATLYPFTDAFPNAKVYVEGSTRSRTRLYRMAIANNLDLISTSFQVYGFKNNVWEKFVVGIDYEAFLVRRKNGRKNEERTRKELQA